VTAAAAGAGKQAGDADVSRLVHDLREAKGRSRAIARQLLPYHGLDAVNAVMPLLADSDPWAAQAAFDVLMDIGNEICAPGREDRRQQAANAYLRLLQPQRSDAEKVAGLRLVAMAAPAGCDLSPIGRLMTHDSPLRDKARVALQRIGTPEARALLRSCLEQAEPAFQCALLNSLGELKDAEALAQIARLAGSDKPAVRAAAIGALSWTGDPAYIPVMRKGLASTNDGRLRFEILSAWLRLAETMSDDPARRESARETLLEILDLARGFEKVGAIVALGRVADSRCAEAILAAMNGPDARIRMAAKRVIETIEKTRPVPQAATRPATEN